MQQFLKKSTKVMYTAYFFVVKNEVTFLGMNVKSYLISATLFRCIGSANSYYSRIYLKCNENITTYHKKWLVM
jgi:hypothetical protein